MYGLYNIFGFSPNLCGQIGDNKVNFSFFSDEPAQSREIDLKIEQMADALKSLSLDGNILLTFQKTNDYYARNIKTLREYVNNVCLIVGIPNNFVTYMISEYKDLYFIKLIRPDRDAKKIEMQYDLGFDPDEHIEPEDEKRDKILKVMEAFLTSKHEAAKYCSGSEKLLDYKIVSSSLIQKKLHKAAIFKTGKSLQETINEMINAGYISCVPAQEMMAMFKSRQRAFRINKKS